jgi:hypothetical protein
MLGCAAQRHALSLASRGESGQRDHSPRDHGSTLWQGGRRRRHQTAAALLASWPRALLIQCVVMMRWSMRVRNSRRAQSDVLSHAASSEEICRSIASSALSGAASSSWGTTGLVSFAGTMRVIRTMAGCAIASATGSVMVRERRRKRRRTANIAPPPFTGSRPGLPLSAIDSG